MGEHVRLMAQDMFVHVSMDIQVLTVKSHHVHLRRVKMEELVPMSAPHTSARVRQDSQVLTVKSPRVQVPRVPTVANAQLIMATLYVSVRLVTQGPRVKLLHVLPHPVSMEVLVLMMSPLEASLVRVPMDSLAPHVRLLHVHRHHVKTEALAPLTDRVMSVHVSTDLLAPTVR